MIHDIVHCKGVGCPIKGDCFRYQAHLEVVEGKYKSMLISYLIEGYLCDKAKETIKNKDL